MLLVGGQAAARGLGGAVCSRSRARISWNVRVVRARMPHRAFASAPTGAAEREGERLRSQRGEAHGHHHRDVSGGWLRPAVFGAMDGLVTNVSLIAGVGGGGGSAHEIVL